MTLKKFLAMVILLVVLMVGFIVIRFGSALSQEGNPVSILISILELDFSDSDYEKFSETVKYDRYVSENTGVSRFDVIKGFMKEKGWEFKEQMGSGLLFDKGEQTIIVETVQYSKYYILWNIPSEV